MDEIQPKLLCYPLENDQVKIGPEMCSLVCNQQSQENPQSKHYIGLIRLELPQTANEKGINDCVFKSCAHTTRPSMQSVLDSIDSED